MLIFSQYWPPTWNNTLLSWHKSCLVYAYWKASIGTLNEVTCIRNYHAHINIFDLSRASQREELYKCLQQMYVHNIYTYIHLLYIHTENGISRLISVYCCSMHSFLNLRHLLNLCLLSLFARLIVMWCVPQTNTKSLIFHRYWHTKRHTPIS